MIRKDNYQLPFQYYQESLPRFVRKVEDRVRVSVPSDAGNYLLNRLYHPFDDFEQEELWTLSLNNAMVITHEAMVYRGTINSIDVRMAEVFRDPIRVNAASLIIAHNHPSGETFPSDEDIKVTEKVMNAGKLLELPLMDHIIVGRGQYRSLRQEIVVVWE